MAPPVVPHGFPESVASILKMIGTIVSPDLAPIPVASMRVTGIPPISRTLWLGANMSREVANGTTEVHGGVQA